MNDFAREHARRDNLDTSHEAAASVETSAQRHKQIVAAAIKQHGDMTSEEIANETGLSHAAVWRRVSDLRRDGVLWDSGERRANTSGRQAAVWTDQPPPPVQLDWIEQ